MLVVFSGLSRAMRFCVCLPASLSPAEAPSWYKSWKNAGTFHIGEGWQESSQLLLGMGYGCALSFLESMAALSKCPVLPMSATSGL